MVLDLNNPNSNKDDLMQQLIEGHLLNTENTNYKPVIDLIKQTFFDGIETIENQDCRKLIEKFGLSRMHEYFPVDKIMFLEEFVRNKIRKELLKATFDIGVKELAIPGLFFIDDTIVVRIHYPFAIAKKSNVSYKDYIEYTYNKNINISANKQKKIVLVSKKITTKLKNILKKLVYKNHQTSQHQALKVVQTNRQVPKSVFEYHTRYPYAAYAHGPHLDSWFGTSFNGINFWWSIEGVRNENGVILYPETFNKYIEHMEGVPYIASGVTLPKPHKIAPPEGSIFIFNSETLHGTQLNVSDVTRVAISTRMSVQNPTYNPKNPHGFSVKKWYSSEEIAKGNFEDFMEVFMENNLGEPDESIEKPHVEKRISIAVNSTFCNEEPIALCPSNTIVVGEKMLVNFKNENIVVIRNSQGLQAVSAHCPHLGINLIDGFHDKQHIYCPGHGVTFCLTNGSSKCDSLKLRIYKAYDYDGRIFLSKS